MTTPEARAQYSTYAAKLINYLRETKMENGQVDGRDIIDIQRDLGQAMTLEGVTDEVRPYFTPEFQDEVRAWAVERGADPESLPVLGQPAAEEVSSDG